MAIYAERFRERAHGYVVLAASMWHTASLGGVAASLFLKASLIPGRCGGY